MREEERDSERERERKRKRETFNRPMMKAISRPLFILTTVARFFPIDKSTAFTRSHRFSSSQLLSSSLPRTLRMSSSSAMDESLSSSSSPSSTLRIALCQFTVTHDKKKNEETARSFLERAKEKGATMTVLPEIWNGPYATTAFGEYAETLPEIGDGLNDADKSKWSSSSASRMLMNAAKDLGLWIVGGSVSERVVIDKEDDEGNKIEKIYNTCLVLNPDGVVVAKHRKVHMFDIDVPGKITFFESETLSPGSTVSHFESPYGEIGVGICYDIRFAEYAILLRQKHNCRVLIYPGAFNMVTGPAHWELLQKARAIDNQCYVVTASPARTEEPADNDDDEKKKYPHYTAWGHSTVISPWGDVVATTDEKESIVIADLDLTRLEEIRRDIPIADQRRTDMYALEDLS
jgi:omega-amidase